MNWLTLASAIAVCSVPVCAAEIEIDKNLILDQREVERELRRKNMDEIQNSEDQIFKFNVLRANGKTKKQ